MHTGHLIVFLIFALRKLFLLLLHFFVIFLPILLVQGVEGMIGRRVWVYFLMDQSLDTAQKLQHAGFGFPVRGLQNRHADLSALVHMHMQEILREGDGRRRHWIPSRKYYLNRYEHLCPSSLWFTFHPHNP